MNNKKRKAPRYKKNNLPPFECGGDRVNPFVIDINTTKIYNYFEILLCKLDKKELASYFVSLVQRKSRPKAA